MARSAKGAPVSAVLRDPAPSLQPLTVADLSRVMAVEQRAYPFPWTRGNFIDSLAAGYVAKMLVDGDTLLAYFVAMPGVDELHLLNLTVAPQYQGQGHARLLLEVLRACARDRACPSIWLEVRSSNARAQAVYLNNGFERQGLRRGYYPAAAGQREDAVVMRLFVAGGAASEPNRKPDAAG